VSASPHAERIERIETDAHGSMTVRVISYRTADAPPALRALPAADVWQLVRFCCVGGSGYALNLISFRLGDALMPYVPAFTIAFVLAALSNFVWNRLWTFPDAGGRPHHQLARFLAVSAAALVLDLLLLSSLVEWGSVPKLPAAAIAIAAVTPVSFLANKHWSFGR
jgi:putative flippase GtrA